MGTREKQHKKKKPPKRRGCLARLARLSLRLIALLLVVAASVAGWWYLTWPDVGSLAQQDPKTTAFIEQSRERKGRDAVQWNLVPGKAISDHLRIAVLVAEDIGFFDHQGFAGDEIKAALRTPSKTTNRSAVPQPSPSSWPRTSGSPPPATRCASCARRCSPGTWSGSCPRSGSSTSTSTRPSSAPASSAPRRRPDISTASRLPASAPGRRPAWPPVSPGPPGGTPAAAASTTASRWTQSGGGWRRRRGCRFREAGPYPAGTAPFSPPSTLLNRARKE